MKKGVVLLLSAFLAIVLASPAAASRRQLTAAERAQINATIDSFVNHAVKRQDVGSAYDTVTPTFRGDQTRKEFARGNIGVFPYPAAGTKHHGWTVEDLNGNDLVIQLFLFPQKGSGAGSAAVKIAMKNIHGRWLVDNMVPGAFFAPTDKPSRVVGTYDFGPGNGNGGSGSRGGVHGVSGSWAFAPFAVFGAIIAALAIGGLVAVIRHRRYVATQGGSLPPLHVRATGEDSQSRG